MKIARVIHQQIFQLRWQLLACLGLVMILPLEEAAVSLHDSSGFYPGNMVVLSLFMSPFLAGLIACANVQADLDEKRIIFWMSKPTGIKSFIMLKYITGLILALIVIACPILFAVITNAIYDGGRGFIDSRGRGAAILITILISLLAYSLCFLCNVLIRKTARAWLIGMTITAFLLLIPFMLPLSFKDVVTDFVRLISSIYISIFLVVIAIAIAISLFAVKHNWHLKTNLKALFWAGAGFVFLLMMLFSRQIANIKVLDEVECGSGSGLWHFGDRMILDDKYVSIKDGRIELEPMPQLSARPDWLRNMAPLYKVEKGLSRGRYPGDRRIFYKVGDDIYFYRLMSYCNREKTGGGSRVTDLKHVYLCSYKLVDNYYQMPVEALDLSHLVKKGSYNHQTQAMRLIGNKLVVFVKNSFVVIKIKDNGKFELLGEKADLLRPTNWIDPKDREKIFEIPLVAAQGVAVEDQIKLSIDKAFFNIDRMYKYSNVDVHDGKISFILINEFDIARYDVIKSDDEFVHCKFRDARPFTFLEQMFEPFSWHDKCFLKDGKFYVHQRQKLMVCDVRSRRIRKLGHFERLSDDFRIRDIETLEDGNILMSVQTERRNPSNSENWDVGTYLYLLKNPE